MTIDTARLLRERLRVLREAKGLSQKELEDGIGKEANYITRVETGRIEWPPSDVIDKICEILEVSPSELLFAEGLDNNAEVLREKIQNLLSRANTEQLRKFYRHMLVSLER
jgi:transcriptional regulator with XRE-family HTH domain